MAKLDDCIIALKALNAYECDEIARLASERARDLRFQEESEQAREEMKALYAPQGPDESFEQWKARRRRLNELLANDDEHEY